MKSKVFNVIIFMFWINGYAQTQVAFIVKTEGDNVLETKFVDVFDRDQGFIKKVPVDEEFLLEIEKESISLVFLAEGFEIFEKKLDVSNQISKSFLKFPYTKTYDCSSNFAPVTLFDIKDIEKN